MVPSNGSSVHQGGEVLQTCTRIEGYRRPGVAGSGNGDA